MIKKETDQHEENVKKVVIALVNSLMATRDAGMCEHQLLEAAMSTYVSLVLKFHAEDEALAVIPQIYSIIERKHLERMESDAIKRMQSACISQTRH